MGSFTSGPSLPSPQPVYIPQPAPTPAPAPTSTPEPAPQPDPDATASEQRAQDLLRRSRGRSGTIRTSFLGLNDNPATRRKTLLGE